MVKAVGAERVVYGSDMPFLSLPSGIGSVLWADIEESEKRLIFGENARRLFRL
jgi:predicted TIM-barrel fold metal-dependent hydrolase